MLYRDNGKEHGNYYNVFFLFFLFLFMGFRV